MEIVIIVAVAIAAIAWWIWKESKVESDNHPLDGATKHTLTETLDVNKDGKVDLKDVTTAVEKVVEKTKKTVAKPKTASKNTAPKIQSAVKKAPTKKAAAPKKPKK